MNSTNGGLDMDQVALELFGCSPAWFIAPTHRTCETIQRRVVGRKRVNLLFIDELQPMLDRSQFAIGRGHLLCVVVVDVSGTRHFVEHCQCGCTTKVRIKVTVHEL